MFGCPDSRLDDLQNTGIDSKILPHQQRDAGYNNGIRPEELRLSMKSKRDVSNVHDISLNTSLKDKLSHMQSGSVGFSNDSYKPLSPCPHHGENGLQEISDSSYNMGLLKTLQMLSLNDHPHHDLALKESDATSRHNGKCRRYKSDKRKRGKNLTTKRFRSSMLSCVHCNRKEQLTRNVRLRNINLSDARTRVS